MIVNEQGRIAWIGQATELPEIYTGSACRTVNLEGARVIPGFVDAHMHAVMLANFAPQISALPPAVNSIEDLVNAIAARRAQQGSDAWVEGWGYDEGLFAEKRSPTRWDLDRGCADAPVCIMRTCGHIRCVNSRALELAGITRDTPDPAGGEIERDANGEPTGVLKETARELVTPVIPKPSREEAVHNIVALGQLLARRCCWYRYVQRRWYRYSPASCRCSTPWAAARYCQLHAVGLYQGKSRCIHTWSGRNGSFAADILCWNKNSH